MASPERLREVVKIMEGCITKADQSVLDEMYKHGEASGKLSKSDILRIWNGSDLSKFDEKTLRNLFEFLTVRFNLGNPALYFGAISSSRPDPEPLKPTNKKELYLETIESDSSKTFAANVLKRVSEKIEPLFNKDLCELSADELIAGMSDMGYRTRRTVRNEMGAILKYLGWCNKSGYYVPDFSNLQRVRADDIAIKRGMMTKLISSPAELREIINIVKSKDDINTDSVVLCLHWLGLTFEEICNLKSADVDLINNSIKNSHFGEIKIPDELIDIFKNYATTESVVCGKREFFADQTEYFLHRFVLPKALNGEKIVDQRILVIVNSFKKEYERITGKTLQISGSNMFMSGVCWRLLQRENNGEDVNDKVISYEARTETPADIAEYKKTYALFKEIFHDA